ncbi:hypothetical protein M514_02882 [Trichuris suis]|uniref:Uncharacterized protein n=1 Tax=Trichuris suis TaxID=68888 RepID=A0A085NAY5_9BILA|nr:hypothetical protein M513_02882 [Trichuris suis]KFD66631.1 hypothetical protein M514_02882 [Trichuris suis]
MIYYICHQNMRTKAHGCQRVIVMLGGISHHHDEAGPGAEIVDTRCAFSAESTECESSNHTRRTEEVPLSLRGTTLARSFLISSSIIH